MPNFHLVSMTSERILSPPVFKDSGRFSLYKELDPHRSDALRILYFLGFRQNLYAYDVCFISPYSSALCLVAVVKMHSISLFEELNGCFVLILLEVDAIIGVHFQTGIA